MANIPTVKLHITRNAPRSFTASVMVRGEAVTGNGKTRKGATRAVEARLAEMNIGCPNWAIVEHTVDAPTPAPVARPEDFDDTAPDTVADAPASEPEPETTFYRPSREEPKLPEIAEALTTGLVTPVTEPERYSAAYHAAKIACGEAGDLGDLGRMMKVMGFASPFDRDAQGKAFHLYVTDELVRAPKAGEGKRRRLVNNNGYERDHMGRSPVEPGSLARETDPRHPANMPERKPRGGRKGKAKVEMTPAQKAASRSAYKAGNAASKAAPDKEQGRVWYKLGYCGALAHLGETSDPKFAKFLGDMNLTEVPADWIAFAARELDALKVA